jgi:glyoxalase family protein
VSEQPAGERLPGIHHVTAICGDPQRNLDYYVGFLGLRLVKKTVNFDDPGSYHLYYGDGVGSPGTIMTFFAWILPPTVTAKGRPGTGQVTTTSFRIPASSLNFWVDRCASAAIDFAGPEVVHGEQVLTLADPDGLRVELVARGADEPIAPWSDGPVPVQHAIRGFSGASLCVERFEETSQLLTTSMGMREVASEGSRWRFQIGAGTSASIDLVSQPEAEPGRTGIGTVHHIAWRTPSPETQLALRAELVGLGLDVTAVLDRQYFESVYFREPGGVLFEIATDQPGFTVDEPGDELGRSLKLPPWLEPRRERIEARLPTLRLPMSANKRT